LISVFGWIGPGKSTSLIRLDLGSEWAASIGMCNNERRWRLPSSPEDGPWIRGAMPTYRYRPIAFGTSRLSPGLPKRRGTGHLQLDNVPHETRATRLQSYGSQTGTEGE
jgi:hypothetical protein